MSFAMLTIEEYDAAEEEAKCHISFTEIMAFATTTFSLFGFPDRVRQEAELARYIDWNNSTSNYQYFKPDYFVVGPSVETTFSEAEAQLIGGVSDHVGAMTRERYGREMRPISSLLSQMGIFRVIMAAREVYGRRQLRTFEVGPGTGYLGALLVGAGLPYTSFDNAQSLYLWQNRLMNQVAGASWFDWAKDGPPADLARYPFQHLPWWQYLRLRTKCPIQADVLVSNTNLGEMNHGALLYTARLGAMILRESPVGLLLFTNIGDSKQNSFNTVHGELSAAGFRQVAHQKFYAYCLDGREPPPGLTALDQRIPIYNPTGSRVRFRTRDVLRVTEETLPMDMDFVRFVGMFSLPE
jgi:hypothetical protein